MKTVNSSLTKEQRQYNGAKIVLSTNRARKTEYPLKKKKRNLDTDFTSFIKISTKWDLNVKHRTIKLLEDNIGENLDDLGYGNNF